VNIDLCACRRIVENEGMSEARTLGLCEELFVGDGQTVFKFIVGHFRNHGAVPALATIKTETNVDLTEVSPEPLSYYASKIFDRKQLNIVKDNARGIVDSIGQDDPARALQCYRTGIAESLKWQFGRKSYVDPRTTVDDRIKEQLRLEELHGTIDGYRTPWAELDNVTRGIHPGETWVIIAAKKVGKSWALILFLKSLIAQGKRPLLVTMEMPSDKIIRRFDALYSSLAFGDLRSGLLGVDGIDRYIAQMKRLLNEGEFWVAGDGLIKCPADVEILAQDLDPDVIMIDGVYLMNPSSGRYVSKYDKVSTVADELQPMPHRLRKPLIYTTQFNRQMKEGSLTGNSGQVGYAYEIVQNCDVALALHRDDDLKASNRMLLSIMEHREGTDFTMLSRWDLDAMDFSFVREVSLDELMPEKNGGKSNVNTIKF